MLIRPSLKKSLVHIVSIVSALVTLLGSFQVGAVRAQAIDLCDEVNRYAPELVELCQTYPAQIAEMLAPLARDGILPAPLAAMIYFQQAQRYEQANQLNDAIGAYTLALEFDPTLAAAYTARSQAYLNTGNNDAALRDLSLLLLLNPLDERAYLSRANLWAGRGERENALSDLANALLINPSRIDTYLTRANFYRAAGETDLAIQDYSTVLQISPNDPTFWVQRAAEYETKRDYQNATNDLRQAVGLGRNDFYTLYNLARLSQALGEYEQSVEWHTRAIELDPTNAYAYYCRGFAHARLKNYEAALADYNQAIALNANASPFYADRARLYIDMGDLDAALQDADRAVAIDPSRYAYLTRVTVQIALGAADDARADMATAYAVTTDAPDTPEYTSLVLSDIRVEEVFGNIEEALITANTHINALSATGKIIELTTLPSEQAIQPGEQFHFDITIERGTWELRASSLTGTTDLGLAIRSDDGTLVAFNDDCPRDSTHVTDSCLIVTFDDPTLAKLIILDWGQTYGAFNFTLTPLLDAEPEATPETETTPDTAAS